MTNQEQYERGLAAIKALYVAQDAGVLILTAAIGAPDIAALKDARAAILARQEQLATLSADELERWFDLEDLR
jgi:hypothetical protein